MTPLHWALCAILVVAFAVANRLWGAADEGGKDHFKLIALGLAIAASFAGGLKGPVLAVAWFAWRSPPNGLFGGSLDPTLAQIPAKFLRDGLLSVVGLAAAAAVLHVPIVMGAAAGFAFAVLTTVVAAVNGFEARKSTDINWLCEPIVGGGFGLTSAILIFWLRAR